MSMPRCWFVWCVWQLTDVQIVQGGRYLRERRQCLLCKRCTSSAVAVEKC